MGLILHFYSCSLPKEFIDNIRLYYCIFLDNSACLTIPLMKMKLYLSAKTDQFTSSCDSSLSKLLLGCIEEVDSLYVATVIPLKARISRQKSHSEKKEIINNIS